MCRLKTASDLQHPPSAALTRATCSAPRAAVTKSTPTELFLLFFTAIAHNLPYGYYKALGSFNTVTAPRRLMRPFHVVAMALLVMPFARAQEAPRKDSLSKQLRLPGAQPEGTILLHNQWSLKPAGKQLELGDFPVNSALHPSGKWLAVLHAGHGEHEIA